jgi:hypothetical protein
MSTVIVSSPWPDAKFFREQGIPSTFGMEWSNNTVEKDVRILRQVCTHHGWSEVVRAEILLYAYKTWREKLQTEATEDSVDPAVMSFPTKTRNIHPTQPSPTTHDVPVVHDVASLTDPVEYEGCQLSSMSPDLFGVRHEKMKDLISAAERASVGDNGLELTGCCGDPLAVLLPWDLDRAGVLRISAFLITHRVRWLWLVAPALTELPPGLLRGNPWICGVGFLLPECDSVGNGWLSKCLALRHVCFAAMNRVRGVGTQWLSGCPNFETLPRRVFKEFCSLKSVGDDWLSGNSSLVCVSDGAFEGLCSLDTVGDCWLGSNAFSNLPTDLFKGLPLLRKVGDDWLCGNNNVESFPVGLFQSLGNLESVGHKWLALNLCLSSVHVGLFQGLSKLRVVGSLWLAGNFILAPPDYDLWTGLSSLATVGKGALTPHMVVWRPESDPCFICVQFLSDLCTKNIAEGVLLRTAPAPVPAPAPAPVPAPAPDSDSDSDSDTDTDSDTDDMVTARSPGTRVNTLLKNLNFSDEVKMTSRGKALVPGVVEVCRDFYEPSTFSEAWDLGVGTTDETTAMRKISSLSWSNERVRADVLLDGYARWLDVHSREHVVTRAMPLPPLRPVLGPGSPPTSPADYYVHDVAKLTKLGDLNDAEHEFLVAAAKRASVGEDAGDVGVEPLAVLLPANDWDGVIRVLSFLSEYRVRWVWVVGPDLTVLPERVFCDNPFVRGVGYLLPACGSVGKCWMRSCSNLSVVSFAAVGKVESVGSRWMSDCSSLVTLPRGVFRGFGRLKAVGSQWLGRNGLIELPDGVFGGLPALESIGSLWMHDNLALVKAPGLDPQDLCRVEFVGKYLLKQHWANELQRSECFRLENQLKVRCEVNVAKDGHRAAWVKFRREGLFGRVDPPASARKRHKTGSDWN